MPFTKGPLPSGKLAARRTAERDVALTLHEQGCGQRILAMFTEACLTGLDPVTKEPIDWAHRVAMGKEVNDRQFGKPAQHLQLDAHVRAQLSMQAAAEQVRDPLDMFTDEELQQLEDAGRRLGIDPTRVVDALPSGDSEDEGDEP